MSIDLSKINDAVREQVRQAHKEGRLQQARHTLMRLRTLQVNAHNERLTAESFREVAADLLDDICAELENH